MKTKENSCNCLHSHLRIKARSKEYQKLILYFIVAAVLVFIGLTASSILRKTHPEFVIGTSILRDINITLFSTLATLLGLYITAFIFLNDSLKNRRNEDTTLKDPVSGILKSCHARIILFAIVTILVIVYDVIINIRLGSATPTGQPNIKYDVENTIRALGNDEGFLDWNLFLIGAIVSAFLVIILIIESAKIMNSDRLIQNHSKRILKIARDNLSRIIDDLPNDNTIDQSSPLHDLIGNLSSFEDEKTKTDYCEILKSKNYSIPKIYNNKHNPEKRDNLENDLGDEGIGEFSMRFGKAVRLLEELLSRICDNNIDRSILSKEKDFENIESGFAWLYSNNDAMGDTKTLDVRDEKRFLDYLKYQLITEKYYSTHPFNNVAFEKDFELLKDAFFKLDFSPKEKPTQESLIYDYKQKMVFIIQCFFMGYKQLVEYRNALIHIRTPRLKISRAKLFANKEKILDYSNTLIQVLIDLFSSFVKINDLNLGNSILDKGWFNYSELSDSSFTHSSFKFARIENAVLKHCDLSTCCFIDADASDTDFSNSNFNYSDLTGTDLSGCTLNEAQMANILLRKKAECYPFNGLSLVIDNALDAIENGRYPKTTTDKETGEQKDIKPELEYAKNTLKCLKTFKITEIDLESILLRKGLADPTSVLYKKCFMESFFTDDNDARYAISDYMNRAYGEAMELLHPFFQNRDMAIFDKKSLNALRIACEIEEITDLQKKDEEKRNKSVREKQFGKLSLSVATLREATANKASVPCADFSYVDLTRAALKDSDLSEATMYYTEALQATLHESNLNQLNAHQANYNGATFSQANLIGAIFTDCLMDACIFKEANLLDAKIINSSNASPLKVPFCRVIYNNEPILPSASMLHSVIDEHAELPSNHNKASNVDSEKVPFAPNCNFFNAIADNVMIINVDMQKSRFENATMRNGLLFNNIMWWNNFKRAELSNAIIAGVSFYQSNFVRAQLGRTFIYSSDFIGANLAETSFISALLNTVVFDQTKLDESNFSSATIKNSTFRCCSFKNVILTGACFENVLFDSIEGFENAVGLEQAKFKNCIFIIDKKFVSGESFKLGQKIDLYSPDYVFKTNNPDGGINLNSPTKYSSADKL